MSHLTNTTKNVAWNTFGSLFYLACQWLTTVVVVRLSGDYEYAGFLSLAMSVSNLFVPIGLYKIRSYQVSDVNGEFSSQEYIGFRIITIVLGLLLVFVYTVITCDGEVVPVILIYCVYKAIEVHIDVFHGIDQKAGNMVYCGISMALRGILSLLAFSLVLSFTGSLIHAISSMVIISLPVAILDIKWASCFDKVLPVFNFSIFLSLFRKCLPAVLGVACCAAVTSFARQILGEMLGASELGCYSSVCAPAAIVQAGALNAYAPFLGLFASSEIDGDRRRFNHMISQLLLAVLGICLVVLIICFLIGKPVLILIYGESIAGSTSLIYGAIISSFLTALIGMFGDLLIVRRKMNVNLVANIAAVISIVPLSFALISSFGANGASCAISLAYCLGCLVSFPFLIK